MHDPRIDKLADLLLDHSCELKPGEKVLIEGFDLPEQNLLCALIEGAARRGAIPVVEAKSVEVQRSLYRTATEESMKLCGAIELARMEQMQAYIGIRGAANSSQLADVPSEKMDLYQKNWLRVVNDYRVPKTKWVVLRYPNDSFAQAANMSTAAFEDFYFDVCTADYAAMRQGAGAVGGAHGSDRSCAIVAPGTELEFSIKGHSRRSPATATETSLTARCFTAPVRDSINGVIRFNTQSRYQGTCIENIEFEFKDGQIVKATRTRPRRSTHCSTPTKAPAIAASGRWDQQSRAASDARHTFRRENRRELPSHPRPGLRRGRQHQPQLHPLGPCPDSTRGLRRRRDLVRRRTGA